MKHLTDPCRYDKWIRPSENGEPTVISAMMYVYFLGSIEAQNLQFTAHLLVRYKWLDHRLKFNGSITEGEETLRSKLWTPHLYLVNEHDSRIMGSGKEDVLIQIHPDGTVHYSSRLKVTLLCLMNLQKFPFDSQLCPLELESWGYNTTQLLLEWENDSPISVNKELQLTEYTLVDTWTNKSMNMYAVPTGKLGNSSIHNSKFSGNYSSLIVYFQLEREVGHYIMDYYVPSILLVVVSWVSFWLDPNAVPGRTTLGTSTMLTFITLSRNIGSSLPKVSYIKATEVWFIVCTLLIFGSLVEFAFVNTIWRRRKNVELKKKNSRYILKSTLTPQQKRKEIAIDRSHSCSSLEESKQNSASHSQKTSQLTLSVESISRNPLPNKIFFEDTDEKPASQHKGLFTMTPQEIAQWIDKRSRLLFPLIFIIFNCLYWTFLLIKF
ncbi:glycine receptor subunit alpha-2-like isoform X2 [Cimex lectularius]|nr:glycine receptor subunit alpha-2-like isoform X2 [Cimex lectularius]XP_024085917.1 glycine receptor subunit alpha-2-like isoform X2 [Cimex lectularius]